jgi:hemerythrin-like domain-containing protein
MNSPGPTTPTAPRDLDGPCDTRMMGIVHSALRRDLVRTRMVLEDEAPLAEKRRVGLADHVLWLMHFLHVHHHGEDIGLYPMVVRNDPSTRDLVDDMDGDHQRIDPAIDVLVSAARGLRADAPGSYDDLLAALGALDDVLQPHLAREELEMMPVVSRCVTEREWSDWNQQVNVKPKPFLYLAEEGHWVLDNLDDVSRALTLELVPPVPRFVLVRLLGGRYRRKRALLWAGSPAEHVPSLAVDVAGHYRGQGRG